MNSPPISGPAATAIAPAEATRPYARGRSRALEVRRHERDDRGQDQRGPDALQERPSEHQHGEARGDRGDERAATVDRAADRKRALAAEYLTELAAGDHQRRHHQRVERDRRLNPGHGRAHIVGDRRDRHVHDGAVEDHQELARREGQQDDSRRRPGPAVPRVHTQPNNRTGEKPRTARTENGEDCRSRG